MEPARAAPPAATWHATLADAMLDRLVHNAYELPVKGESRRKDKTPAAPAERPS
jgi:IstB-like ATP binding protein